EFPVRENGLTYLLSFAEGYSTGLFLDQRDNRRRLLKNWIGPDFPVRAGTLVGAEVLNLFAYTCAFSVAAAAGGAITTSLDLSRKYLDWGRRNMAANQIDATRHDFIFGDVFEWLRRLSRKGRSFDVVLLDPPTFSQSREHGVFKAETGYAELVAQAARVLRPGGVLLASTNAARLDPEHFLEQVRTGLSSSGHTLERELFVPQPPDFPTHRDEPGYLKTVWLRTRGSPGLPAPGRL
ncbi:MAG: class I SAM-dependent rRNA methyltransferase, partial [Verrucomicrobiales bacterium]|nr:class I SAM-dependent rRNA methyltransferase [Verrucomicrobiales bacterium]